MSEKVIFLEFNEICIDLIDAWIKEGKLPNFGKLQSESSFFNTLSDADVPFLEPWIQWHSIHVGKSYDSHQVYQLTDGLNCELENIWEAINKSGHNVASIGSMNVRHFEGENCVYIPDPWCFKQKTHPVNYQSSYDFISRSVTDHSRHSSNDLVNKTKVLTQLWQNGLYIYSIKEIIKQLALEKFNYEKYSWRRPILLDLIQFDFAKKIIQDKNPKFISFFSNSVAHFQHSYWRYFQPHKFASSIGEESYELYKDAVYYGYAKLDTLLGKFMRLAENNGYKLAVCSALSQRPYLDYEEKGGRHYYRIIDESRLLESLGIDLQSASINPIMAQQYKLHTNDTGLRNKYIKLLEMPKLSHNGAQLFEVYAEESNSIAFGCQIYDQMDQTSEIIIDKKSLKFFDLMYKMPDIKSGEHDPSGLLFLPGKLNYVSQNKPISILDITPTLLNIMGVGQNNEFFNSCEGTSLLKQ